MFYLVAVLLEAEFGQLEPDLPRGDLLERNRHRVGTVDIDHGQRTFLQLPCPFGGDDDQSVLVLYPVEQRLEWRLDHIVTSVGSKDELASNTQFYQGQRLCQW